MLKILENNIKTLTYLTRLLISSEKNFIIPLIFANYTRLKLLSLIDMKLRLKSIPDEAFQLALKSDSVFRSEESYVDSYSCILVSDELVDKESESRWYYVCNLSSLKKYRITILRTSTIRRNEIVISDTTKFNIQNYLKVSDFDSDRYFIIAATDTENSIAEEVGISLIENPKECTEEFVNDLLNNYFSSAKYLRLNDVLSIDVEKFTPSYRHVITRNNCGYVLFKIVYMNVDKLSQNNPRKGSFVVRGITTLIQKQNINFYSPARLSMISNRLKTKGDCIDFNEIFKELFSNCPPALKDPLKSMKDCIYPFTKRDNFVNVRPIFLVKGAKGSGKSTLVRIAAQRMGLNLINVDISEVQSLTSAQTEAKIRIILHNASKCVPSILLLTNIQIFGKDAEGKEDERIISSFDTELNNFCNPGSKFPLIVVATANNSLLPAGLDKIFIETIYIKDLTKNDRLESLKWLMGIRGIEYDADLSHVAALCNDFLLADLNAIVLHAAKIKIFDPNVEKRILSREEFEKANEYMQSRYSDWMGAPRVPKVRWEDIGGLANLKTEILRRIELPLMTSDDLGLRRSGLLLYGPPGTGKTLLAKAVATECQVNFLSVKGPELLNMYVGQSEKNVREVFARARSSSPCVIFFDELDSLAPNRGHSGDSGGVMDRVVSQLLSEIDGVESNSGSSLFIIGATNRPDLIDPALLRPGRFDKLLYVGISQDKKSKISIIHALTRKFQFKYKKDDYIKKLIEDVVEYLPDNLTGADLYAVCSDAWLSAVRRYINRDKSNLLLEEDKDNVKNDIVIVEKDDFINSAKNISPSVSKEELKRYEKLKSEFG